MSKKFDMDIIDNIIIMRVNIPDEECQIINKEINKGVDYWKKIALENVEESLKSECIKLAPKSMKISSKNKIASKRTENNLNSILSELKSKYIPSFPEVEKYIPNPPDRKKVKTFKELESELKNHSSYVKDSNNFVLKNVCLLGQWLSLAYDVYRYDKLVNQREDLPKRFELWLRKHCKLSKTVSYNYRNFSTLVGKAPKIINCRLGLIYFIKHHDILSTYFRNNGGVWKHKLTCDCDMCEEYFSDSKSPQLWNS